LLGIAYELQKQSAIKVGHWDIPLDAIVTEQQLYNVQA
jgi:5-formyltetrahydrofolate cyclo-ligase